MAAHAARPRAPALLLLTATLLAGCATHRPPAAQATDALSQWIERMRVVSSEARVLPPVFLASQALEGWDPALATARRDLLLAPSAQTHIAVAIEYRRLGILDHAYSHLSTAIDVDRHNATAYDLRARIWRDWGFPHLGYADAYRALELAPYSPSAANTLGTLFHASGNELAARNWYERALTLDSTADYALMNVCGLGVLQTDPRGGRACVYALARHDAVGIDGTTFNNVTATRLHDAGVTFLIRRDYGRALEAFATAWRINPLLPLTPARSAAERRLAWMTR